jgi:hypothetical protein
VSQRVVSKGLLDKKRVAEQLRDALSQYAATSPREAKLIMKQIRALENAFGDLSKESMDIAVLIGEYADKMKR